MRCLLVLDRHHERIWLAACPSIPGCVSQGKTRAEALRNVKEAIQLCLEVRAKEGLPLRPPWLHRPPRPPQRAQPRGTETRSSVRIYARSRQEALDSKPGEREAVVSCCAGCRKR